jgi:hypothetical protein
VIPWHWLLACGCVLVSSVYGLEWLVSEGPERARAGRIVAGVLIGFLLIRTFLW